MDLAVRVDGDPTKSTRVLRIARSSGSTSSATLRTFSLCLRWNGDEAMTASPSSAAALQLPQRRLGGPRRREHPRGPLDVAVPGALGRVTQQRRDGPDDDRGLAPWPPQRRRRDDRRGQQRDGTADHRVEPPGQRVAWRRDEGHDEDRLHRRLGHEQSAGVEEQRRRHGERGR